jgi:hypothetical protein
MLGYVKSCESHARMHIELQSHPLNQFCRMQQDTCMHVRVAHFPLARALAGRACSCVSTDEVKEDSLIMLQAHRWHLSKMLLNSHN